MRLDHVFIIMPHHLFPLFMAPLRLWCSCGVPVMFLGCSEAPLGPGVFSAGRGSKAA